MASFYYKYRNRVGGGGSGITELTGDITAGPGSGSQAATIPNDTVTYAKMQNVSAASRLLGRGDSGSGDVQEITLGANLTMTGTTLSASGGGGSTTFTVTAGENLSIRDAVYISKGAADGGRTAGRAYKLDPTNDDRIEFLGFATAAITAAATGSVQVAGELTGFTGLVEGQPIYASVTTPGSFQATAPNVTGQWIVPLGAASLTTALVINGGLGSTAIKISSPGAPADQDSIGISLDGGGSAITTGVKGYVVAPYACTITGWYLVSDVSGSIVIDVWKTASPTIPTVSNTITGTEKPTLSSAQFNSDTTLTTWTTSVAVGDIIAYNVDSASTLTKATLTIKVTKV